MIRHWFTTIQIWRQIVLMHMRITRAAYSKQSKQNLLNQGKIKKSSHIQVSKMYLPSILLGRISANIWTWLDRMQVKDPALNYGTIQTRFIVQLKYVAV